MKGPLFISNSHNRCLYKTGRVLFLLFIFSCCSTLSLKAQSFFWVQTDTTFVKDDSGDVLFPDTTHIVEGDTIFLKLGANEITEKNLTIGLDDSSRVGSWFVKLFASDSEGNREKNYLHVSQPAEGLNPYSLYGDSGSFEKSIKYNSLPDSLTESEVCMATLKPGTKDTPNWYQVILSQKKESISSTDTTINFAVVRPLADFSVFRDAQDPSLVNFKAIFPTTSNVCAAVDEESIVWDFGVSDPDICNTETNTCNYPEGEYEVSLTVSNEDGLKETIKKTLIILPATGEPVPSFTVVVNGRTAEFTDTSSDRDGQIVSWFWDFGDPDELDDTSNDQNPTYTYNRAGTFSVSLTVTDNDGISRSINQEVVINPRPIAAFNASTKDLEVTFSDRSVSPLDIVRRVWDFGDGKGPRDVLAADTTYAYDTGGTYTVTLIVFAENGEMDEISQEIVVVAANEGPEASFQWERVGARKIRFTSDSFDGDGSIVDLNWDFGHQEANSMSDENPVDHTFPGEGPFVVTLTVTDNRGATGTFSQVFSFGPPVPSFTALVNGMEVTLLDESVDFDGTIESLEWDLGNGKFFTQDSLTYRYTRPGQYTVSLSVTDNDGLTGMTERTINVKQLYPIAAFSTRAKDLEVTFTDRSVSDVPIDTLWWDFGDSTQIMIPSPGPADFDTTHSYQMEGTYVVTLVVSNTNNQRDTTSQIIEVIEANEGPVASFTISKVDSKPRTVRFENTSTDAEDETDLAFEWGFGDGNKNSTSMAPEHTYEGKGPYEVTLTVRDSRLGTGTASKVIEFGPPVPAFTAIVNGLQVNLQDKSVDFDGEIENRRWVLVLPGETDYVSELPDPVYRYVEGGEYIIRLWVTDNDGFTSFTQERIEIDDVRTVVLLDDTLTFGGTNELRLNLDDFFPGADSDPLNYTVECPSNDNNVACPDTSNYVVTTQLEQDSLFIALKSYKVQEPRITNDIRINVTDDQGRPEFYGAIRVTSNHSPTIQSQPQDTVYFYVMDLQRSDRPPEFVPFEESPFIPEDDAPENQQFYVSVQDFDQDEVTLSVEKADDRNETIATTSIQNNERSRVLIVEPLAYGKMDVIISARDGKGGLSEERITLAIEEPKIEPVTLEVGKSANIEVSVPGNQVKEVYLAYRKGGGAFTREKMSFEGNDTYSFNIPEESVTLQGLNFYADLVLENDSTRSTKSESSRIQFDALKGRIGVVRTYKEEFRLFSIPMQLEDSSLFNLLKDDLGMYEQKARKRDWRIFDYEPVNPDSGVYIEPSLELDLSVSPGKAYWINTKSDDSTFTVQSLAYTIPLDMENPFEMSLKKGWNLVGNPYLFDVPVTQLCMIAEYDNSTQNQLSNVEIYQYEARGDPKWAMVDTLKTYGGYAIKSPGTTRLLFYPFSISQSTCSGIIGSSDRTVYDGLQIVADNGLDGKGRALAALSSDASRAWDAGDKAVLPIPGDYLSVQFTHPDWEGEASNYWQDVRPVPEKGDIWNFEVVSSQTGDIELTFEGLSNIPDHFDIMLVDPLLGTAQDLRAGDRYTLGSSTSHAPRSLQLVVGTTEYVEEQTAHLRGIPDDYELSPNFPNPFQGGTTIPYELPEPVAVSITVYDILGRHVTSLMNSEEKEAGKHAIVWDGRNNGGSPVASGVYFVRFSAGPFSEVQKITKVN